MAMAGIIGTMGTGWSSRRRRDLVASDIAVWLFPFLDVLLLDVVEKSRAALLPCSSGDAPAQIFSLGVIRRW